MKKIKHFFSSSAQVYDLVTVGPYANKVAHSIWNMSENPIKILTIQEENYIEEPSLLPYFSSKIKLNQSNYQIGDCKQGVGLKSINPKQNSLTLKNSQKLKFKYLVYSGTVKDWKDLSYYPFLEKWDKIDNSFIHSDYEFTKCNEILDRVLGKVVFTLPKGRHFGCQNYLMMYLQKKMRNEVQNKYPGTNAGEVIIVNQGNCLIQQNLAHNALLEKLLKKAGVQHYKNQKFQINYDKKQINLTQAKKQIKFDSIFQHLPLTIPQVLPFNPFQNNHQTLNNSQYKNIYILGNVFPNTYSVYAMEKMTQVMSQNICNKLMGVRKQALYEGDSTFNIWVDANQSMKIKTNYNSNTLIEEKGKENYTRFVLANLNKLFNRFNIQKIINDKFFAIDTQQR